MASMFSSFLVRAPITAEDDSSDYESQTENVYSDSEGSSSYGSELEEFASGEEFESASEKPFADEEGEDGGLFVKYGVSRPFVGDLDEGSLGNSVVDEEEEFGSVVEPGASGLDPGLMPIAQLSIDEDDVHELVFDEGMVSGEEEDGRFGGVEVIARVDSMPRVRVSDIEEGKDDELLLQVENGVELGVNGDVRRVFDGSVSGELVKDDDLVEKNKAILKENVELSGDVEHVFDESVPVELVEKKEANAELNGDVKDVFDDAVSGELVKDDDLVETNEAILKENVELSGDVKHVFDGSVWVEDDLVEEKKEAILKENAVLNGDSKDVFDDAVSDELVKDDDLVEKNEDELKKSSSFYDDSVKERLSYGDFGQGNSEMDVGDKPNVKNMEIDFSNHVTEQGSRGSELNQVHTILAELQELEVDDGSKNDVEAVISLVEADEATSFEINGKSARETDEVHESLFLDAESERNSSISSIVVADDDENDHIDGRVFDDFDSDSTEEMESDKERKGNDILDPAAFAALLRAAAEAELDGGKITLTSPDGRVFSVENPGSSFDTVGKMSTSHSDTVKDVADKSTSEEDKKQIEKIHHIRVKFLMLVQRLGLSPEDSVVAQVLYRLVLASEGHVSDEFSLEAAKKTAEAMGEDDDLDFALNILVLGKTGVGKSAMINSIFGEKKALINAFEHATSSVKEIVGAVNGVRIRVLDSPGFRSSLKEEATNRKILASIKKLTKKFPPDVVLYVDRLDTYTRDFNDLPLLSLITSSLTTSIWRNAIVVLTHAAAVPPDGPYGYPLSFETFVARRSHVVQQAISQAVGDKRLMDSSMMHPVALVENHPSCRKNEDGESILSNGQSWRPQLLLLCYSLKILSEADSINKPRNPFDHKKLFGQLRSLPAPQLLSSLLQPRPHPKLSPEQGGDDVDSDVELLDLSDSDEEDEDEYDRLPPFKPLKKSEVTRLSKEQRKAYFEEYDYRVNLLQKKQLKVEVKRLKELKQIKDGTKNVNLDEEEEEGPATVPVAMPEFSLPVSFDSDNPSYRYRALEPTSQLLIRPVLDSQGWDHDFGYDGINLESYLAIANKFPGAFSVQITKDKKEFNIHIDSSICAKHHENGSTMAALEIENLGRQLVYILKTESQFKNFKLNKTSAGLSLAISGENVAAGLKFEDQITFGKQLAMAGSAGAMRSKGETAFGANFEIRLKNTDYPVNQNQSTLGFSLMKWRSDLGFMANLQSQFSIGRNSKMAVRLGMNNKQSGQISIKNSSSELQIAAICIVPILASIARNL